MKMHPGDSYRGYRAVYEYNANTNMCWGIVLGCNGATFTGHNEKELKEKFKKAVDNYEKTREEEKYLESFIEHSGYRDVIDYSERDKKYYGVILQYPGMFNGKNLDELRKNFKKAVGCISNE